MGPLSLADLIGLDIVLDIMETLYNGFDDSKYRPSPLLKQICDAGYIGRKTGKRFGFRAPQPPRCPVRLPRRKKSLCPSGRNTSRRQPARGLCILNGT